VATPEVRICTTEAERDDAFAVRIAVFVDEQRIPREEELDEHDDTAVHCVAYVDGRPVGAGRLIVSGDEAKIGRMAVLREHRGDGVGRAVLEALEREGRTRGVRRFRLSAQLHAAPFYERAGYRREGDIYDEVGIPHIAMSREV
jgi:predicted GNAT family N-acyltransferase